MKDIVFLTGTKENPYPYMKNCTVYVQPSYQEGFCVATFEAKILQIPVVVTDVPGMREQFTEETAWFAEPTVESLTRAIGMALDDPHRIQRAETVTEAFNEKELEKICQLIDSSHT